MTLNEFKKKHFFVCNIIMITAETMKNCYYFSNKFKQMFKIFNLKIKSFNMPKYK